LGVSGSSEKAMSVIAALHRTNSIALSRHWKQTFGNRFRLIVSSDFAVATAMRQDEIARVEWRDFDASSRMLVIRNRKDPRKKKGNDQRIPLLDVSGYDACKIIEEQGRFSNIREGRIFPYNGRSVGTAFRRQCQELKIEDLHFRDLRHEGTHRLFEAGFSIEQVALVTGHKDWKMLRRYTQLKPETLHSISSVRVA
jgi:integrase